MHILPELYMNLTPFTPAKGILVISKLDILEVFLLFFGRRPRKLKKPFVFLTINRGVIMEQEHALVTMVYAAKDDTQAADDLVRQYLPFIRSETAKFLHRMPVEGEDDELSIAMFAFHEAVLQYQKTRGAFLRFAAAAIKNRLIDHARRERRHQGQVSLHVSGDDDDRELLDKMEDPHNELHHREDRSAAQREILEFSQQLSAFGLSLTDIADNCPRQKRTLEACHQALAFAISHPELLEKLVSSKKLPLSQLALGSGTELKTLERHRRYLVAAMLAYTNGFEIIRGHLQQVNPREGDRSV